jgi:copper chaperone CopZ
MESKTFSIPNISCDHCVMSIKRELSEIEGVSKVEGSTDTKKITVQWDIPATLERLKSTLKEINYPADE